MVGAKNRHFEYEYETRADKARSAEYYFVKYFNTLICALFLLSSAWILVFIFRQADWERNANEADIQAWTAVGTWTWWNVVIVIAADISVLAFFFTAVWSDRSPIALATFAALAYLFSLYGIVSVYLRGSIVCFVFPFVIATLSVIQFLMQRHENEEFEITQGLRLHERDRPTMQHFLSQ